MTVCLDTGVFLQIFGRKQPFQPILRALLDGRITLAVSTEILLEYQEIITQLSGAERWRDVAALLDLLEQLHDNIRHVEPQFRFNVISTDPDDNKFCNCAIAGEANFVVAEDNHFNVLKSAGYKPKPNKPDEFTRQFLTV
ncbi:MAG TPA: putative toxin-antitoxin system toxin component, PIN family [Verrucomicrobiae bacterium]